MFSCLFGFISVIVSSLTLVIPLGAGISNASHPMELNKNGDNFIRGRICMRPLFNSMALQQYILLCSQVFFHHDCMHKEVA